MLTHTHAKTGGEYRKSHHSPRLKRIMVLAYLRRQQERGFMHKTRRFMDEDSVSFQLFLILLSFIKFVFRKPNFCVQAMSEQYLDVCCCCFIVRGEHAQKPRFGETEKTTSLGTSLGSISRVFH